jgi:hypothetical protein
MRGGKGPKEREREKNAIIVIFIRCTQQQHHSAAAG